MRRPPSSLRTFFIITCNPHLFEDTSVILIFPSQDFKKTTKLTWIAESAKAPLLPTIAVQFDDVISKPVLTKNDDFKDYINKDSKVRPEAHGRVI